MKKVSIIAKVQTQMLKGAIYNILIEVTGLTLIIITEGKHQSGCNGEKKLLEYNGQVLLEPMRPILATDFHNYLKNVNQSRYNNNVRGHPTYLKYNTNLRSSEQGNDGILFVTFQI